MIKGKMPTYINSESARLYCNFADVDQRSDETMCVAGTELGSVLSDGEPPV